MSRMSEIIKWRTQWQHEFTLSLYSLSCTLHESGWLPDGLRRSIGELARSIPVGRIKKRERRRQRSEILSKIQKMKVPRAKTYIQFGFCFVDSSLIFPDFGSQIVDVLLMMSSLLLSSQTFRYRLFDIVLRKGEGLKTEGTISVNSRTIVVRTHSDPRFFPLLSTLSRYSRWRFGKKS